MDVIITCPRPKPGCRSVLPRLRPDPYPSRIAPLDLSRPPRTVHLPTEIIALIFEMINSERLYGDPDPAPATLRSCCLVASSVLGPARRALYRQIFVHVDRVRVEEKPPSNQWALLLETLAAHPYLAARVRHFELWVGYGSAHVPGYEVGLGLTGDLSTSALARSLRACRNVVSVSLVWGLWVPSNRVLKTIAVAAHNLRELSLDMYGSPSIVKKNFMNLLRSQPHLKSLHINGPVPSCDGEVPVVFALEGLAVSSVTAIDTSSFFKFVTASSHSSLRSLSLPLRESPSDIPTLARFSQLVSLTLTLKSSTSDPTFILAQLPIVPLTDLSIYNYTHSPLPALPSFPFLPPTLETLTLSNGHLPREIISFLNSDQCPLLRAFDAWDSSQTLSPFDQVALASACRRRGLELEQPAPLDGVSSEEYEERKRVDRERTVVKKMRPLESYWTRGA